MIKRGCGIAGVVLVALFAVYFRILSPRIELLPAIILALFGALGLVMLVSQLKEVIFGSADSEALKRAEQGLPLEDGKVEAAWGRIEALGATLEAPFSGRPCVAYEYDAKNPLSKARGNQRAGSSIAGFALAPSVIRSTRGDVNVLGFSMLEKFEARTLSGPEAHERATRYAASTGFTEIGLTKIGAMISAVDAAMADDDGSVRQDMRRSDCSVDELGACTLEEKVIAPGDTVTVIGVWDAAKGGLVPKHRGKTTMVRLMPGGGAAMVALAGKRPWGQLVFAIVWAGFVHAFIFAVLKLAPPK